MMECGKPSTEAAHFFPLCHYCLQVIKQRFEDESSVFKAYEDAIHDIRVDLYLDGIKPRKSETDEEREESAARNIGKPDYLDILWIITTITDKTFMKLN